jgi:hypothetical protein
MRTFVLVSFVPAAMHVSIRQHTSAYASIRQQTSAYASIRFVPAAMHSAFVQGEAESAENGSL